MSVLWKRQISISERSDNDLAGSLAYCRNMARSHYENFVVGSILAPRKVIQHLHNIYAFCRYSDDLADEVSDPNQGLVLLNEWRQQLRLCYEGVPDHPVLKALQHTIKQFDIPAGPFEYLISAFEQDCRVTRYKTFAGLMDYCERSANPVGRLFLWVFGYNDAERQELSDQICTGLQLANFWQDVASDFTRGRVYIPKEDLAAFGCSESDIELCRMTPRFAQLMRFEVDRTEELFRSAVALPSMVNRRLAIDIELFRRAGLAVLSAIRKNDFDTLAHRPTLSKVEKAWLLAQCVVGKR